MEPSGQDVFGSDPSERLVTLAVDDNMAYAACVLIYSLDSSARAPFSVALGYLRGSLSRSNQDLIQAICRELEVSLVFEELAPDPRFITQGHISATTFTKFQLADLHPESHLWIDADTVALPGWDGLFSATNNAPLSAGLVVAERGDIGPEKSNDDPSALPFNAGILGWPRGRRKDWSSALDQLKEVSTQEQFLLNHLYSENAMRVSEQFNMLTYRIDTLNEENLPFVIHYAGAHKPWQLQQRFRFKCMHHRCPWTRWYVAEEQLHLRLGDSPVRLSLRRSATDALRSGLARASRQHSGLHLLKILNFLGPLGWPLVWAGSALKRFIPRGTHPLH